LILLLSNGLFPSREGAAEEPRDPGRTRAWLTAAVAVVVAGNVLLFAFAPFLSAKGFRDDDATFLDKVGTEFFLFTGRGIRTSDRYYGAVLSHIRENFSPADTLIFTNFKGWAYAQYYLREFRAHNYFCLFGLQGRNPYYIPEGTFPIPEGMNSLVLFNGEKHSIHFRDALEPYNRSEERTRVEHVFGDIELRVLDISGEETLHLEPDGFYLP